MILCITEKPSVAKDIAAILSPGMPAPRRDGFYDCGDYVVTWTYGHLCCLKDPADYTDLWKRWSLSALPMIPERFGIKVIDSPSIKKQFAVIESLVAKADSIVNCGDAGQEGELIQRWVMQKASAKCPVRRLWISSLTDESIREGFANLRPQSEFDNLYYAGLSRAVGDWILGLNATRLYSLKYSGPGKVLSIGRVQTPTLALIVQRQREIENFRPEDFWEIRTLYRDVVFNSGIGRFDSEAKALELIERIAEEPLTITDVQQRIARESPPRLFDLTGLQVECNKRWGWSADITLKHIQSLYEKKVTTYPRVDTTYLSTDIYPKIPDILRRMTPYAQQTASLLAAPIIKPKRIFDNAKVTDHHAIIPTGQNPSVLAGDERKLYHLIALRFIAAFYPDCTFQATTVEAKVLDVPFKASGKVIQDAGWRSLYNRDETQDDKSKDDDDGQGILPSFSVGENGPHKPSAVKKTTQPPKPYTEGTLLRAMESAGKTVDDEALREAMKENGIGRPSTRAAIIETLFKRGYIRRERKSLAANPAGIELIDTISEELLKSAKLTGLWENKLRRIERAEYSPSDFISELKQMIAAIVHNVLSDNTSRHIVIPDGKTQAESRVNKSPASESKQKTPRTPAVRKLEQIMCPKCGKGHLLKGRTAYGCSLYASGCDMRLPFENYPGDLTPGKLNALIKKQKPYSN